MKKTVLNVLTALILASIAGMIVLIIHFAPMAHRVETASMTPTLPVNSFVVSDPHASYKPGDVITFNDPDQGIVTHRLMAIRSDGSLITRGDANPKIDQISREVMPSDVIGKVIFTMPLLAPGFWLSRSTLLVIAALMVLAIGLVLAFPKPVSPKSKPKHVVTA